jgi:hypothetical protein
MGVKFAPGGCDIRDATIPSKVAFSDSNCNNLGAFQARFGKIPNRINMYVVDTVEVNSGYASGNGTTCGTSDFAVVGAGWNALLAIHELGHNFSLLHIDSWMGTTNVIMPGFDVHNFMHSASVSRKFFSEGQLFRAHFTPADPLADQPGSALNSVYNARVGQPVRDCTMPTPSSAPCPVLDKRIWADGAALPPN